MLIHVWYVKLKAIIQAWAPTMKFKSINPKVVKEVQDAIGWWKKNGYECNTGKFSDKMDQVKVEKMLPACQDNWMNIQLLH
jgi:hypothetical protein